MPRRRRIASGMAVIAALGLFAASASTADAQRRASRTSEPPQSKGVNVEVPPIYPVGAIVIVNSERKLYYVTGKGEAIRYGVAVGKNAELWMGRTFVAGKAVDPKWIPVNGDDPVEGGDPANPLGKRALYLDWSLLRIHGTPSRASIGSATSNGCVRMLNEDVIDLFERVHLGAPVYAIESWAKADRFEGTKVADKIYVDPVAHREAQEELREQMAELARQRAEQLREERRFAIASRRQPAYTSPYAPFWFNSRSTLGGWR